MWTQGVSSFVLFGLPIYDIGAAMSLYGFPESADWRALGKYSDYDDFYIASKSDAELQIKNAEIFVCKVCKCLRTNFLD